VRRFFRTTYSLAIIVLFILVALGGFTQTKMFRSYVRTLLVETVASELRGELYLGPIEGNLITGFRVDSVSLRTDGEEVVTVQSVEAKYDPLGLLAKRIAVSRLTLKNPVVRLNRSADGSWNIARLLKSSGDSTPSSWALNFKQIQIVQGSVRISDSLSLARRAVDSSLQISPWRFDYVNLRIDSISLDAGLSVAAREIGLLVRSVACTVPDPRFQVKEFSGEFELTPTAASVRTLDLQSGKSHVRLDARMDSIDITKISELAQLRTVPIAARLNVENLDFGELKQFIGSPVKFLEREVACQAVFDGAFGAISARNVTIETGSSVVRIAGTVTNLHRPSDLELDLASFKNKVDPIDVQRIMPSLGIPDLTALGTIAYDLEFKGRPTLFHVRLSSVSAIGSVGADGNLDVRGGNLSYDGDIKTSEFNLAPLAGDSALASNLKMHVSLQGQGTRLSEMTSTIRAEIDSSRFYNLPVGRSVVVVDVADRVVRPRLALHIGSAQVDIGGTAQIRPLNRMSYDLSGRVNSMNLAEVTHRREHKSDVSFDLQAKGEFETLNALSGTIDLTFSRSSIDTVRFDGGPATIHVNTLVPGEQTIEMNCDVIDLGLRGYFTPSTVVSSLGRGVTLIKEAFRYRISTLDSTKAAQPGGQVVAFRSGVRQTRDSANYSFNIAVKNSFPLGVLLGRALDGNLTMVGRVTEGVNGITLRGSTTIPDLWYSDPSVQFALHGARISFDVGGLSHENLLQTMALSFGVKASRFDIEDLQTADLQLDAGIVGDSVSCQLSALLDSLVTVRARGSGRHANRLVSFDLNSLEADFSSRTFQSTRPIRLLVGRDGLRVANLIMRHENEEVAASGLFDPAGSSDLTMSLYSLDVSALPKMFRRTAPPESLPVIGGLVSAVGWFRGTFEEPQFSLELSASGVRYETEQFGQITLRSSYADRTLNVDTRLQAPLVGSSAKPELEVKGTIPYDLSFREERGAQLEGEMNLDVRADRFRLEVLDPFVPEISNLRGVLTCDMKLRGTVSSPSYEGALSLENARFLFDPLGIQYIVDGKLVPHGRQIALENVALRNTPEDRSDGKVNLTGSFSLEGLKIKDFDLSANGQLLVMKESARWAGGGLYGDLFAGIGPGGVQWKGTPSRSFATGGVFVKYANLTLPPTREVKDLPNSRIEVRFIDDKREAGPAHQIAPKSLLALSKSLSGSPRPGTSAQGAQEVSPPKAESFLDNIVYNLTVESQGVTQLRFVFNDFTNEQLLADLQGRTAFTRDGEQMRLTGELKLGSRSYYNYFKKLDATGKLRFTGDPLSPELDVVASYEGVHRGALDTATTLLSGSQSGATGSEKVVVKVYITGSRDQPKVRMSLERYDPTGNLIREERKDVEGDAIAFLVTGTFRDELTQQDRLSLAGSSVLGGMASSILSGPLTDLLRKEFGIVRSVDVLYYGGSFQESADLRLTGELGEAVFRLGGRVLSDLNNTNVSIQLPMSAIVGSEKWRNLVLEAERTVQGVETFDQRRESRGVRLLYRIIF
jgi:hypothetical protein